MSVAIGIDLGTTNTAVAAVVDGVAVTLEDERGRRLLPSVVSFHPSGTVLVGDAARDRRLIDPENTVYSVKPLIGRAFDSDEVVAARGRFPFALVEGAKKSTMVHARGVDYALPEISAFVLRRAKAIAEHALKTTVERAVVTVPANFNDLQRASTKIAGKLAGLDVMRILNEPTAAALAYGQSIVKAEKIAVYDLGGGTFDITLLDLTGNVFEVLATAGDTALGGDDIDRIFAERIALEVTKRFNIDPRTNPVAFSRLRFIAEEIKKELSTREQVQRQISDVGYTEGGNPIVMPFGYSRVELERLVLPIIERTVAVARQSIEIVGLTPKSFDRVLLVGGSTRMPLVQRMVEQVFGQKPHLKVNPDEVVALGAAIQAHALNRSKSKGRRSAPSSPDAPPAAPAAPAAPARAPEPETLQFSAFSKSRAVITFSPPAAGGEDGPMLIPPAPALPGATPAARRKPPPPPTGPVTRQGKSDHAGLANPTRRSSAPPIEGKPLRAELAEAPSGPKPARASVRPTPAAPPVAPPPPAPPSSPFAPAPSSRFGPGTPGGAPIVVPAPSQAAAPQPAPPHFVTPSTGIVASTTTEVSGALELDFGQTATQADFARGSAIATNESSPLLIDVTPLSLRVETVGGYSDVVIDANSPVPCEKTRVFLTASDRQVTVTVRVAQGEATRFRENTFLGELELSGLEPRRRGEVKILVTFELDADGILKVRARDQETGRETKATMKLLGTNTDEGDVAAMAARQARHAIA